MPKILLAEDNQLNRDMLSRRLERKGFKVVLACDGQQAVDQATKESPDVILMDMSMPVLDGWSATRRLKGAAATRSIPIVALTAHAMIGDREKALEAGCDDYEMKPIELDRLLIKIQALLDKRHPPAVAPVAASPFALLVVDDNEMNREMLARRLQRPEYRITKASSGREALDLIARSPFDLVLLDSMMPEMSGLDVLRRVRETHTILDLPVIMATAKDQTEDVVAALELGANDYVIKPLNFPIVLARVQTQLALKRAHLVRMGEKTVAVAPSASLPVARPVVSAAPAVNRLTESRPVSAVAAETHQRPAARARTNGNSSATLTVEAPPRKRRPATPPRRDPDPGAEGTWVQEATDLDWPSLAGYEILGELGRGGMGVVYKARHEKMDRMVALKVIDKHHLAHPDAIRRFYREIRAVAQLSHPNIVLAYDAGQVGGTHYFAMEYVEGLDLGTLLKQRGPLAVEEACLCVRQAAHGLQHAHERNMVHRDVKPSNLLITWPHGSDANLNLTTPPDFTRLPLSKATIKILDMGLALLSEPTKISEAAASLTRDNRVVGTADYMAPEQWMNAHKVDVRADLYSLGCTLYFLLTGQVPFPSEEPMEKMLKHHLDEPVPLERLRPGIPPRVAAVVRRLMAKKPEHRFQQPAEVVAALA